MFGHLGVDRASKNKAQGSTVDERIQTSSPSTECPKSTEKKMASKPKHTHLPKSQSFSYRAPRNKNNIQPLRFFRQRSSSHENLLRHPSADSLSFSTLTLSERSEPTEKPGRLCRFRFLTSFSSRSFNNSINNSASIESKQSTDSLEDVDDLAQLEKRMADVVECQKVDPIDSTTGAHVAVNKDNESLFIIKSNSESHFELIGNCFAEALELNIPGFALLSEDFNQYDRFKSMLKCDNPFPFIVSEFKCAINLKEVTPGKDQIDTQNVFFELGKAFLLDWIVGNWDRFPVFANDSEGNFGNIMYEPFEHRLLFIDTVAQKHTEIGNYGSDQYLSMIHSQLEPVSDKITSWLANRFPMINETDHQAHTDQFKAGVQASLNKLIEHQDQLSDLLSLQSEQLSEIKQELLERRSELCHALLSEVTSELDRTQNNQNNAARTCSIDEVIQALSEVKALSTSERDAVETRIRRGGALPRFGGVAKKLHNDKSFLAVFSAYGQGLSRASSQQALVKVHNKIQTTKTFSNTDVEELMDLLKLSNFKTPILDSLNKHYEMYQDIQLQNTKLDQIIGSFKKVLQDHDAKNFA